MTALELYKFINDNNVEYTYISDDEVIIFPYYFQLEKFSGILTPGIFDDGGLECEMQKDYIVINIVPICNYYDIDYKDIFNE